MGGTVGEKVVEEAARGAREEIERRTKEHDRAAVKVAITVECEVDGVRFEPPMRVVVNGQALPGILNDDKERGSGALSASNRRTVWCEVPVRLKGPDAICITLEPVRGAAKWFHRGTSEKRRFQPAFTRNAIELHGGEFRVPPMSDEYAAHEVVITVKARRKGVFNMVPRTAGEIREGLRHLSVQNGDLDGNAKH